jgi:hypothetical protein
MKLNACKKVNSYLASQEDIFLLRYPNIYCCVFVLLYNKILTLSSPKFI